MRWVFEVEEEGEPPAAADVGREGGADGLSGGGVVSMDIMFFSSIFNFLMKMCLSY